MIAVELSGLVSRVSESHFSSLSVDSALHSDTDYDTTLNCVVSESSINVESATGWPRREFPTAQRLFPSRYMCEVTFNKAFKSATDL